MTTHCIAEPTRLTVAPIRRDLVEAIVAAAAIILLLPTAVLVMSVL
jgi:hypothetical protein